MAKWLSLKCEREGSSVSKTRWLVTLRHDRKGWENLFSAVLLLGIAPETHLVLVMEKVLLLNIKEFLV